MDLTIIKVGGSLSLYPHELRTLCSMLNDASKRQRIVIVPGGGEFADVVRALDKRFVLSAKASHQMAILAMDQYGYLIADLLSNSCLTNSLGDIPKALGSGKLPVFLPSQFFAGVDPLPNSWDITSDSISVYIANQLNANKVVLITDVDGIYTKDPKQFADAKFIPSVTPKDLSTMEQRTSVDKYLPNLLVQSEIKCYVVNGLCPRRVFDILDDKQTICTVIT